MNLKLGCSLGLYDSKLDISALAMRTFVQCYFRRCMF